MIRYDISLQARHSHHFDITLTIAQPAAQQLLSLPVWIPGSYMVREFGRHLSGLEARQGKKAQAVRQLDKTTWEVSCSGKGALTVTYRVYAFDTSVRCAYLDDQRGFFNGTGVCLRVHGHEDEAHEVHVQDVPKTWQVATGMLAGKVNARGEGHYTASDYDELVDHPFEFGPFWRGRFKAHGVVHEFVVAGAFPDFDGERLLADTQAICEAQIAFWHPNFKPPFQRYVFMLNAVEEGYGGLEHRASTALIAKRADLPVVGGPEAAEASEGYRTLLGLISHEYFHTWNVKRLRPAELAHVDYSRENYTELLWFFEGFTSYYDDLFLRRTGLITQAQYLALVSKTITTVQAWAGRHVQSVAEASFDAWVKYYRQDENTPNATISYYTKGSLVALCLDLNLLAQGSSLDDVMRALWLRSAGGPISEADILQVVSDLGSPDLATELQGWVHARGDLPLAQALAQVGMQLDRGQPSLSQQWGMKVNDKAGLKVTQVDSGSLAEQAGLAAGDELLALDNWRLRKLDDAQRLIQSGRTHELLVCRDQRMLKRPLALPKKGAGASAPLTLAPVSKAGKAALKRRQSWLEPR